MKTLVFTKDASIAFVSFSPAAVGDEGDLARLLRQIGHFYLDESFHYRAPLFPYFLAASHRLFAADQPSYLVCSSNLGKNVKIRKPVIIFMAQFWAVVVPVFFNISVIFMTFFLGRLFFNEKTGLLAAFLMAVNPISLTLAYRLLTEDVLIFFMMVSLFLYFVSLKKKNLWGIFAAGLAAGLAILAKQSGGLLLPMVGSYAILMNAKRRGWRSLFSSEVIIYFAAAFLVSGFWFFKIWQVFGNPLHQPGSISMLLKTDRTGWFLDLARRPPPFIFFILGTIRLNPIFSIALFTIPAFFWQIADAFRPRTYGMIKSWAIFWIWILAYYIFIAEPWNPGVTGVSDEHRFFYPAYPAIAILAASVWDDFCGWWVAKEWNGLVLGLGGGLSLFLNAYFGISFAMKTILSGNMVF